jgi:hypothetical protein
MGGQARRRPSRSGRPSIVRLVACLASLSCAIILGLAGLTGLSGTWSPGRTYDSAPKSAYAAQLR